MALAVEKLGTTFGRQVETVAPARSVAYAAATNDDNPAYLDGTLAPPVFAVVPTWEAMSEALTAVVPPELFLMIVHGEHDMHFHRPLAPGQVLATAAEAHSLRVSRSGTRYTMRVVSTDSDDEDAVPVLEQYCTMFVRRVSEGEDAGPDKPDHTFPKEARDHQVGAWTVHVDEDQTFRYAEASGDHNAIHLDAAVATGVGLPGIILHGLCTMAMTGQSVLRTVAGNDPARLRRLAVRFSRPVFPGNDVVTTIFDAGQQGDLHAYAFEAESAGQLVISNGRAEVGP
ncbi:MAG: MaoC/PaaZ C-terminal domain-containing protein [Acidimicrobiales bacterium]